MRAALVTNAVVEHPEYGLGKVVAIVGAIAAVEFYGERIDVPIEQLLRKGERPTPAEIRKPSELYRSVPFRRAFEAINLGVVPPDAEELIKFTIRGEYTVKQVGKWFRDAPTAGLCKAIFGDYGTGKSHFLRLIQAIALEAGWVVSLLEFDPKAADPAKPHLVYRGIVSHLRFPKKQDGTQLTDFSDLILEIRKHWEHVASASLFRSSPWFKGALETLRHYAHNEDQDYKDACAWLSGAPISHNVIQRMTGEVRRGVRIPRMPRLGDTADIYVHHLTVLAEIVRTLGYRGLVIILDEAEHVRGYNVRRKERANNLFDLLARAAHRPLADGSSPLGNDQEFEITPFWRSGPHLAVLVGLTQGNTFADPTMSLRDACVFLHSEDDRMFLIPPSPQDYENWCLKFLEYFNTCYPEASFLFREVRSRQQVAEALRRLFENTPIEERVLRLWIKLAALGPSILLAGNTTSVKELIAQLQRAAGEVMGLVMPWDE